MLREKLEDAYVRKESSADAETAAKPARRLPTRGPTRTPYDRERLSALASSAPAPARQVMRGSVPYAARYHGAQYVDTSSAAGAVPRAPRTSGPVLARPFGEREPSNPRARASVGPGSIKGTPLMREKTMRSQGGHRTRKDTRSALRRSASGASGPPSRTDSSLPVVNHQDLRRMSSVMGVLPGLDGGPPVLPKVKVKRR